MKRVKIMVGNKEVQKRYIGNKLVWENIKLIGTLERSYVMFGRNYSGVPAITVYPSGTPLSDDVVSRTQKIFFNNVEIAGYKSFKKDRYTMSIEFNSVEEVDNFKRKAGIGAGASDQSGVTLKFYGK